MCLFALKNLDSWSVNWGRHCCIFTIYPLASTPRILPITVYEYVLWCIKDTCTAWNPSKLWSICNLSSLNIFKLWDKYMKAFFIRYHCLSLFFWSIEGINSIHVWWRLFRTRHLVIAVDSCRPVHIATVCTYTGDAHTSDPILDVQKI